MSEVVKVRERNDLKFELKIVFILVPLVALLCGVGIGLTIAMQSTIIYIPWLPIVAIVPVISFVYLMKHYLKKIDLV
jgi:uncharacterized membrane protein